MSKLSRYRLDDPMHTPFTPSMIRAYNQLSHVLNTLSSNLCQQYWPQKEFADNPAHEMQPPLIVLTTQVDNLTNPRTHEFN